MCLHVSCTFSHTTVTTHGTSIYVNAIQDLLQGNFSNYRTLELQPVHSHGKIFHGHKVTGRAAMWSHCYRWSIVTTIFQDGTRRSHPILPTNFLSASNLFHSTQGIKTVVLDSSVDSAAVQGSLAVSIIKTPHHLH